MQVKAAIATILLLLTSAVSSQDFPNKPIRLIDAGAPSASTSAVSRAIAQKFQEVSGQPLVVEYRPGAGTNLAGEMVAKAVPDGYTVLLSTSSLAINPNLYRNMPFDPIKDLAPIILLTRTPNVFAVHPSLPVRSVKELIEYARARPGQLNYASAGNGTTNHMAMELLKTMAKVDIVHVPYKGGGEAVSGIIGGHVQMMFSPASNLVQHDKTGKVRIIAIGSSKRVEGVSWPTVAESGLPGFESTVWFGLFAPAGTLAAAIARLNADVNRILKDKQIADILNNAGFEPVGGTPEEMRNLLAIDNERWGNVVKATGAKIE